MVGHLRSRGYAISGTKHDVELSIDMLQEAVESDPEFLRAWVRLAEQCSMYATFFSKDENWRRRAEHSGRG